MSYYWGTDFCLANSVFSGRLRKDFSNDFPFSEKQKSKVMKFHQILLCAVVFLTACSPAKYAYHFDQYDYNSGRKNTIIASGEAAEKSPLLITQPQLTATTSVNISIPEKSELAPVVHSSEAESLKKRFDAMSKTERKDLKKALRKDLKNVAKRIAKGEEVQAVKAAQGFDALSGLAILFGGAGIVMITLASISNIFWILGAISLVIGAFFFVKWVSNGNG